ncbi:conserved Plasmodium protein, unknown function [Plasmodium malariae]|uniref:Uncharacterized protein n=1 Tax=Plasmodium malariae TaxID=5858 RepID=A0A1D3SMD6_PLAMA|nr:conserved Plasmodium protein, unknown function [Plasmodium malariae]SCO92928.1 conserved Plasmodium protein, unknown function [Plasmodium malariae]
MDTEWASKILSQLLIKEKCLKEKYVYNLLNKFGDVNQIIQHMNEKLEVLGFIVNNELIKGEEYLILNCGKLKRPENNTSVDVAFNIKEEYLFNSHFKKNEISLYYLIIDYIVNNNKYLKIDCDETSYESLCLKLNIKNTNVQKSILDKLIAYNWLKFEDGQLAPGLRFFTDLIKFFPLNNLDKCSLCNNSIIVKNMQCTNCLSVYHIHCFNALAKKLELCFICKNSL